MDDKTKQALMVANELEKKQYIQDVRQRVGAEYPHPSDELAILRKAVAVLFEVVATLHPGEINNAEFAEYNAKVEAIKTEVKGVYKL